MFKYSYQASTFSQKVRGVTLPSEILDSPKTIKKKEHKVKTSIQNVQNHPKYHQLQYSFCIYVFQEGEGATPEFKQVISD